MSDVVDIFSKQLLTISPSSQAFDYQGYINNVRQIQAGFYALNAHQKGEAMDAVANAFCEILERVFARNIKGD